MLWRGLGVLLLLAEIEAMMQQLGKSCNEQ